VPSTGRYVIAADAAAPTLKEVAMAIAAAFDAPVAQFPASAVVTSAAGTLTRRLPCHPCLLFHP
jgi:hypothetical protein